MSTADQHAFLVRLLFDEELRGRFFADPEAAAAEEQLAPEDLAPLRTLDRTGLEIDARIRREYLMSALCRAYPLTSAALGSVPGGSERLAAFLASPKLIAEPNARTQAYGEHLRRLLSFGTGQPPVWTGLVGALFAFEHGLVLEAARLRQAIEAGAPPPSVEKAMPDELADGRPKLAPYSLVVELPAPTAIVRSALSQVTAEDAWARISSGALSADRLLSVARADPMQVTVIARAVVRGAPALGISPVIEVVHLSAEIAGRRVGLLHSLDGSRRFADHAPADRSVLERLAAAGLIAFE